jgi:probable F420-dependent oxidoreductase
MTAPLKVGLNIVWVKPELVIEYAQLAESLGFESVWSGEHVCLPAREDWWNAYPAAKVAQAAGEPFSEGMVTFKPGSDFLDPMTVLATIAGATERIRLGIGIYLLVLRDPILVGRTIASLDVLSGGRLDMAVGIGWTGDEYQFTRNVWETRGRRTNEMIRCLRTLFEEDTPEFHGEFFDFPKIGFQPKPVQKPRLPIHIGGGSVAAARRAATIGDGWYGHGDRAMDDVVRAELKMAGREGEHFQFSAITLQGPLSAAEIDQFARDGLDRVVVTPWPGTKVGEVGREGLADVERLAKTLGLQP